MATEPDVRAAGAVLWKPSRRTGVKIAVVHRPTYRDWSLPKGKAEPGESDAQTAAREVLEETGFQSAVGRALTSVSYRVSAGLKTVQYFAARSCGGTFSPSKEVDRMVWLSPDEAAEKLTYEFDIAVLETFLVHPADLRTVVLVRHAKAGHRESWDGDDQQRPLDPKGQRQAHALENLLQPFGPRHIVSAPAARCRETVAPLAQALGLPVDGESELAEEVYRSDPAAARKLITELAVTHPSDDSTGGCAVVCSQGGVIPGVIKSLASRADLALPNAATPKGSYWTLSFHDQRLVQADFYPAPKV